MEEVKAAAELLASVRTCWRRCWKTWRWTTPKRRNKNNRRRGGGGGDGGRGGGRRDYYCEIIKRRVLSFPDSRIRVAFFWLFTVLVLMAFYIHVTGGGEAGDYRL